MGRLDVSLLPYITKEDFRVLIAIEMGMKNHELVPGPLVAQIANLRSGGVFKKLKADLCQHRLASYERGKHYDGYRLTNRGYDFLALKSLSMNDKVLGVGSQIGVGKESDILVVTGENDRMLCLKIHRLGRTSFRKLKEKRDYHRGREMSWIYLSRLSAAKEYAYLEALYNRGFPVPEPIAVNRHCVVMELVNGYQLHQVRDLEDPSQLYSDLMDLIVQFANNGVIHSDFNEFNVMVTDEDKPIIIDFPQMVSTSHENAKIYFDRDVQCVVTFFKRRFGYESELSPDFDEDVKKVFDLDKEVMASGYKGEVGAFDDLLRSQSEAAAEGEGQDEVEEEQGDNEDDTDGDDASESEHDADEDNDEEDDANTEKDVEIIENKEDGEEVSSVKEVKDDEETIQQKLDPASEATFNATLNMYFESMKNLKQTQSLMTNLNCCPNEICTAECFHNSNQVVGLSLGVVPEGEVTDDISVPVNIPLEGNSDKKSTTSKASKKSRRSQTGQKLDEKTRKAMKEKLLEASRIRKEAREKGEVPPSLAELLETTKHDDDRLSCYSFSTLATSVHPKEFKMRAVKEVEKIEKKQVSKKNLRVKGEANAYTRKNRENALNIKETMACDDVWG